MSRTPFVAGNWKMFKTTTEAGPFVAALARQLPAGARRRGVRAVHRAGRRRERAPRASSLQVFAQNMHQAPEGAFTGEISAGDARAISVSTACCWATPSGASTSTRPMRRWPRSWPRPMRRAAVDRCRRGERRRAARRCRPAGARPPAGRARRVDAPTRSARPPSPTSRSGRSAPADRHARDGAGGARAHPRGAGRGRRREAADGADPVRRQHEARERRGAAGAAGLDGALIGGASLDVGRLRRDPRRRGIDAPGGPVVLVVLDGWGLAPPGRATPSSWPRRRCSTRCGGLPHTSSGIGPSRGPARRPDGQLRGRPHQPGRRSGRAPGSGAHRRRHRRRPVRRTIPRSHGRLSAPAARPAPARAALRRRGRTATSGTSGADRGGREAGVEHMYVHAFTDGRDVRPRSGAGFARSDDPGIVTGQRAATGRWIAIAVGIAPNAPTTRSCTGSGRPQGPAGEAMPALLRRQASATSSSSRP